MTSFLYIPIILKTRSYKTFSFQILPHISVLHTTEVETRRKSSREADETQKTPRFTLNPKKRDKDIFCGNPKTTYIVKWTSS